MAHARVCFLKIQNYNHKCILQLIMQLCINLGKTKYFAFVITEVIIVQDQKSSSLEILFESVITLSYTGKLYVY